MTQTGLKLDKCASTINVLKVAAVGVSTSGGFDPAKFPEVGSGIFKSADPAKRARAIVKARQTKPWHKSRAQFALQEAVTHYNDPQAPFRIAPDSFQSWFRQVIAEVSEDLGEATCRRDNKGTCVVVRAAGIAALSTPVTFTQAAKHVKCEASLMFGRP